MRGSWFKETQIAGDGSIAVALVNAVAPSLEAQTFEFGAEFPLVLESVEVYGAEEDLGVLIDSEFGPDGSVYLADMSNSAIVVYSPSGDPAWTTGGHGEGPGEFRSIYRLAVTGTRQIYALDHTGDAVSRFASGGEFIDRKQIKFTLSHVDDMVVTGPEISWLAASPSTVRVSGTPPYTCLITNLTTSARSVPSGGGGSTCPHLLGSRGPQSHSRRSHRLHTAAAVRNLYLFDRWTVAGEDRSALLLGCIAGRRHQDHGPPRRGHANRARRRSGCTHDLASAAFRSPLAHRRARRRRKAVLGHVLHERRVLGFHVGPGRLGVACRPRRRQRHAVGEG